MPTAVQTKWEYLFLFTGRANSLTSEPSPMHYFQRGERHDLGPDFTNTPLSKGVRVDNSSTQGVYGTFSLNTTTGAWTYVLDNTRPATQALNDAWVLNKALQYVEVPVTELLPTRSRLNRQVKVDLPVRGTCTVLAPVGSNFPLNE